MNKRNGTIEFLRFAFSLMIVALHGEFIPSPYSCKGGYLGVEFFFIVTGIFLAQSIRSKCQIISFSDAVKEGNANVFKRVKSIFPYLMASTVLAIVVRYIAFDWAPRDAFFEIITGMCDLTLAQNYGFSTVSVTQVVWYLGAMFFALWIIYPILRKFYNVYVFYISPVLIMSSVGFIINNFGSLDCAHKFYGVLNTGFIRAVSMISLGCVIFEVSEKLKKVKFTAFGKLTLKFLQIVCLVVSFGYIITWELWKQGIWDHIWLLSISIVLICVLTGNDAFDKILNNKLCCYLGKTSVVIFLNHFYWFTLIPYIINRFNLYAIAGYEKYIAIVCSILSCVLVKIVVNLYLKYKSNIKQIFVSKIQE